MWNIGVMIWPATFCMYIHVIEHFNETAVTSYCILVASLLQLVTSISWMLCLIIEHVTVKLNDNIGLSLASAQCSVALLRQFCNSINAIPLGPMKRLKACEYGSQKHVTKTWLDNKLSELWLIIEHITLKLIL